MPEVQAHAERLTEDFGGAELTGFRPLTFTALKTFSPAPEEAVGHPLREVGRRGKHLLLRFEPVTFVVHLMQGGRLKPDHKQAAKPKGGQARWTFADGRALLLTEAGTERKAGVWVVAGDPQPQEPLAALGACMTESLAYERTRSDMSSSKDRPGAVHHRTGEACPVCGDTIRAVEYRSYTVNYCPTCQTGGKGVGGNNPNP